VSPGFLSAWDGSGLPPPAPVPSSAFVDGLRGRAGALWLLGTSALAALGEVVRLCFGTVVGVCAVARCADSKPFVLAEDCLQGDAAYV